MVHLYLITNLVTQKRYVGLTTKTLQQRWNGHKAKKSTCTHLKNSIQKYGEENFTMEHVFSAFTLEDASKMENYFISYYNTLHPHGYNLQMSRPSDGLSKATREAQSTAQKKNWDSIERRKYYAGITSRRMKNGEKKNLMRGIAKYVEGKREKIVGVSVYDGSLLQFGSVHCAVKLGYFVGPCLANKVDYANGYVWFYDEGLSDEEYRTKALLRIGKFDPTEALPIEAISKETGEVKNFKDLQAIKSDGTFDYVQVRKCLRGRIKSHNGFIFKNTCLL